MKAFGFDINIKKAVTAGAVLIGGTLAAVMGKSKLQDSVNKIESKEDDDPTVEIEDAELKEYAALNNSEETASDEAIVDVEEVTEEVEG